MVTVPGVSKSNIPHDLPSVICGVMLIETVSSFVLHSTKPGVDS